MATAPKKRARLACLKPRVSIAPTTRLKSTGGSWRDGKTTNERGYTYAWQTARERFLRANPLCVYCKRKGKLTAASVVDHVIPHRGDQVKFWDETNLQALCAPCHDGTKAREERGSHQRHEIGLDGYPVGD